MATTETVFIDPVYKAFSFGISSSQNEFDPIVDEEVCYLEVIKRVSSRRDNQSIVNDIVNIITNYFNRANLSLGQTVDTRSLTQQIFDVNGVETIFTTRSDEPSERLEGLSFFVWNPIYPVNDKNVTGNNVKLRNFEYPFFNNIANLASKIKVTAVTTVFETTEY
jgi:hypothetical protein